MPIEHIYENDSLNTGRKKINDSIDASDRADRNASEAVTVANEKGDKAVKTAERAEHKSDSTQQQLDNIVIESGTSDAEVIQARTDAEGNYYQTLKRRTDADYIGLKKELRENKNNLETKKADKTEVRLKADKIRPDDVSDDFLSMIGEGEVTVLSEPKNESVTPRKVYKHGVINLLDKGLVRPGTLNKTTGVIEDSSQYHITGMITCEYGDLIKISWNTPVGEIYLSVFDKEGNVIDTAVNNNGIGGEWSTPDTYRINANNPNYLIIKMANAVADTSRYDYVYLLNDDMQMPSDYIPFNKSSIDWLLINKNNIPDRTINHDKLDLNSVFSDNIARGSVEKRNFTEGVVNLFNPKEAKLGTLNHTSGEIEPSDDYIVTDYISIRYGDLLSFNWNQPPGSVYCSIYDRNKNKIGVIINEDVSWSNPSPFKIMDKEASFIVIKAAKEIKEDPYSYIYLLPDNGNLPPSFVPYRMELDWLSFNSDNIPDKSVTNEKLSLYNPDKHIPLLPDDIHLVDGHIVRLYESPIFSTPTLDFYRNLHAYSEKENSLPFTKYFNGLIEFDPVELGGKLRIAFSSDGLGAGELIGKDININKINDGSGKDAKFVILGDSITYMGLPTYVENTAQDFGSDLTSEGTYGDRLGTLSEGRSSFTFAHYVGYSTVTPSGDYPGWTMPFLKLATEMDKDSYPEWCFTKKGLRREKTYEEVIMEGDDTEQDFYIFDWDYYLNSNNVSTPDIVIIALGINDFGQLGVNDALFNNKRSLDIMINQIRKSKPSTIIGVVPTWSRSEARQPDDPSYRLWITECMNHVKSYNDVDIIGGWMFTSQITNGRYNTEKLPDESTKFTIYDNEHPNYSGSREQALGLTHYMLNKL